MQNYFFYVFVVYRQIQILWSIQRPYQEIQSFARSNADVNIYCKAVININIWSLRFFVKSIIKRTIVNVNYKSKSKLKSFCTILICV